MRNLERTGALHELKKELLSLRRVISAHREMANAFARDQHHLVSDEICGCLQNSYDQTVQLMDTVDIQIEVASGLVEIARMPYQLGHPILPPSASATARMVFTVGFPLE